MPFVYFEKVFFSITSEVPNLTSLVCTMREIWIISNEQKLDLNNKNKHNLSWKRNRKSLLMMQRKLQEPGIWKIKWNWMRYWKIILNSIFRWISEPDVVKQKSQRNKHYFFVNYISCQRFTKMNEIFNHDLQNIPLILS